jgi:hypothetical protein
VALLAKNFPIEASRRKANYELRGAALF